MFVRMKNNDLKHVKDLNSVELEQADKFHKLKKKLKTKQVEELKLQILNNQEQIDRLQRKNAAIYSQIYQEEGKILYLNGVLSELKKYIPKIGFEKSWSKFVNAQEF